MCGSGLQSIGPGAGAARFALAGSLPGMLRQGFAFFFGIVIRFRGLSVEVGTNDMRQDFCSTASWLANAASSEASAARRLAPRVPKSSKRHVSVR